MQSESLQSHQLENQSSVESSSKPAEQSQPLRKEKLAAHLFRQALSDAKTEAQRTAAVIKTTTQGTVTDRNCQDRVMTYIVEHFHIDGQQVVKGDVHENDHVFGSNIADIGGLRESTATYDRARTVNMTRKLHRLRTTI